jgi:hypothetical protein
MDWEMGVPPAPEGTGGTEEKDRPDMARFFATEPGTQSK